MEEIFLDKDSSGLRVEYLEMPTGKISWNILVSDFYGEVFQFVTRSPAMSKMLFCSI